MLSYLYLYNAIEYGAALYRVCNKIRSSPIKILQLLCEMLRCKTALEAKEATEMLGVLFGCPQVTYS